jgi:isopentenyldiphosphate isomerase
MKKIKKIRKLFTELTFCNILVGNEQVNKNKHFRAGSVAQTVEWLLCKLKALSSNSSPTKKNK